MVLCRNIGGRSFSIKEKIEWINEFDANYLLVRYDSFSVRTSLSIIIGSLVILNSYYSKEIILVLSPLRWRTTFKARLYFCCWLEACSFKVSFLEAIVLC